MPFEHVSRAQRRAMASHSRSAAKKRPAVLTPVPMDQWPPAMRLSDLCPVKVFESRQYLVQVFEEGVHYGSICMRLSVLRVTLQDGGRWDDGITWDELMQVKRDVGYGDCYAIEVYPADQHIVNVANLRHLWVLDKPLTIGWSGGG